MRLVFFSWLCGGISFILRREPFAYLDFQHLPGPEQLAERAATRQTSVFVCDAKVESTEVTQHGGIEFGMVSQADVDAACDWHQARKPLANEGATK